MYGLIFAIAVAAVSLIFWVLRCQNRLVHADELCGNALSQIGVQQASRWDALSALAELCKGYSSQEYRVLSDTIAARKSVGPTVGVTEIQQQEQLLSQGFSRIHALAEAYPELKSNTVYIKTMDSVDMHEDHVRKSRMVYNDTVTKYNRLVRALPASLVAAAFGHRTRAYLEEDAAKTQMPSMTR